MHSPGAVSARAHASRINGARSRGPRTAEGKARSSRNALRHGLRAQKIVLVADEDPAEFEAFEDALLAELAPQGALQTILVKRVVLAAWRLARADRIEGELFERHGSRDAHCDLALALIRDGNGARAFPTLLRYRGAALAEFWRALHTLKALQAQDAAPVPVRQAELEAAPTPVFGPARAEAEAAVERTPERRAEGAGSPSRPEAGENPIEPESRTNPRQSEPERGAEGAPLPPPCHAPGSPGAGAGPIPTPPKPERARAGRAADEIPALGGSPMS